MLSDVFRRFEKNAICRNSEKNSKGRFFKLLYQSL